MRLLPYDDTKVQEVSMQVMQSQREKSSDRANRLAWRHPGISEPRKARDVRPLMSNIGMRFNQLHLHNRRPPLINLKQECEETQELNPDTLDAMDAALSSIKRLDGVERDGHRRNLPVYRESLFDRKDTESRQWLQDHIAWSGESQRRGSTASSASATERHEVCSIGAPCARHARMLDSQQRSRQHSRGSKSGTPKPAWRV